jgi:phage tail sheath protein FI
MTAGRIMSDRTYVRHNLLIVPGIRESYITDYISNRIKENYGLSLYIMDIPSYNSDNSIIFDLDKSSKPNVLNTIVNLNSRTIDNSFVTTYFPDVFVDGRISRTDETLTRRVKLPSSVAAFAAMSYSDSQSPPWFAPAGFNRGILNDIVKNSTVRINADDKNSLYEARVNPIAKYYKEGYVVFGQKTLQIKKSSLDRINVRRLLLELRRIVIEVSKGLLFEQNTNELRAQFIRDTNSFLGNIRSLEGIEEYKVIMDNTNNTEIDAQNNRLNGKIIIKPTKSIEYIAIDFVIANSSVQFV